MKKIVGVLMVIAGICVGVYVGGYICLYGGIVAIIEQVALVVNGGSVVASILGLAIVKIIFAGFAGFLSGIILFFPGVAILQS